MNIYGEEATWERGIPQAEPGDIIELTHFWMFQKRDGWSGVVEYRHNGLALEVCAFIQEGLIPYLDERMEGISEEDRKAAFEREALKLLTSRLLKLNVIRPGTSLMAMQNGGVGIV